MGTVTTYSFNELSDTAKEKAREWYRSDYEFESDAVIYDAKTVGKLMGFDIDDIYYSGFYNQGDGAKFTGTIRYAKGCTKAVKAYAPEDTELQRIAKAWQDLQRRNFYSLFARITSTGHYQHEMCTLFDCEDTRDNAPRYLPEDTEDAIKEIARDFMRWIYKQLEAEYEYHMSDTTVDADIEANDYNFLEDGRVV